MPLWDFSLSVNAANIQKYMYSTHTKKKKNQKQTFRASAYSIVIWQL